MKQWNGLSKEQKWRFILLWMIRGALFLLLIGEVLFGRARPSFALFNIVAIALTFVPEFFLWRWEVTVPTSLAVLLLVCIFLAISVERLAIGPIVQLFFGMALGMIGFLLMLVLYSSSRVKANFILVVFFAFCFGVAVETMFELVRYQISQMPLLSTGTITVERMVTDISYSMVGACILPFAGYIYVKYTDGRVLRRFSNAIRKNRPEFFEDYERSEKYIRGLIAEGEGPRVEFKSTLRTNLHLSKVDGRMEHEVARSIVAFLNADGGTLLIGVDDRGEMIGLESDGFKNKDQFYRHFTNLLKKSIGNEFLPLIRSDLVKMGEYSVLCVHCMRSKGPVFLKWEGSEEFYVRSGPASVKLSGSKLIRYIGDRYERQ